MFLIRKNRPKPSPSIDIAHGQGDAQQASSLLLQDNSIPGNHKDGFRFHYLIFAMIATPIYLWLELSFGVRLLDHISGNNTQAEIDSIEHWGRLISGCAVSLLFLTQWFGQCEKWDRPLWIRFVMAAVICAICVPLTWMAQSRLIDFYVERGASEITVAIPAMVLVIGIGLYAIRRWLHTYGQRRTAKPAITIGVLLAMALGIALAVYLISRLTPTVVAMFVPREALIERLGEERQQAALLSVVRRGMQAGFYSLSVSQSRDLTKSVVTSPEGKSSMAMFPVLGSAMDQTRFRADLPRILRELMYLDWEENYGTQAYTSYQETQQELKAIFHGRYHQDSRQFAGNSKAWEAASRDMFDQLVVPPNLSEDAFVLHPNVGKFIAKRMACFDCQFTARMQRAEYNYELFLGTQTINFQGALDSMQDSKHFETGRDGETAARTYWVPIWALLFSMIGAFTHIFKLSFTIAEYANLRSFAKVNAADSPLSNHVIDNTRRVLLALMAAVFVFIYFSENRVTEPESYKEMHRTMWRQNPVVGGLAAHWTINAQALIYPFTRKTTPDWLDFSDDPFTHLPLSLFAHWVKDKELDGMN